MRMMSFSSHSFIRKFTWANNDAYRAYLKFPLTSRDGIISNSKTLSSVRDIFWPFALTNKDFTLIHVINVIDGNIMS